MEPGKDNRSSSDERPTEQRDEVPRQSLLAVMPKGTFFRVVVLLAGLGGILYLRERTGSIAGCMSNAFRIIPPPAEAPGGAVRARIEVRQEGLAKPKE